MNKNLFRSEKISQKLYFFPIFYGEFGLAWSTFAVPIRSPLKHQRKTRDTCWKKDKISCVKLWERRIPESKITFGVGPILIKNFQVSYTNSKYFRDSGIVTKEGMGA